MILTLDLLCSQKLILRDAASVIVRTRNQMSDSPLSKECFVMPKALNNLKEKTVFIAEKSSCSDNE